MTNIFFRQISRHIEHVRRVTHGTALAAVRAAEHRIYDCFSTEELLTLDRLQRKLLNHLLSLIKSEQKEVPNS